MTSVEYTAKQVGPVVLHVDTTSANVEVVADPRVSGWAIELHTDDENGPAVKAIREAQFRDEGGEVHLKLNEDTSADRTVSYNGDVVFGDMIQVAGRVIGRTIVNGQVVSNSGGTFSSGIRVRAMTEPGSSLDVRTTSGDVAAKGINTLRANTRSGNVTAENIKAVQAETRSGNIAAYRVSADSTLTSRSGDIHVTGSRSAHVEATTRSGDVTGSGVDLSASSRSGRVRQVRPAADEW